MGLAVLDRQALPLNDALDIPGPSEGGCGLHGGVCPRKWPAKHPGVCCPFVEEVLRFATEHVCGPLCSTTAVNLHPRSPGFGKGCGFSSSVVRIKEALIKRASGGT